MWPRTDLLDLLGFDNPIIQAPMAGSTTPALAAAVSNAGGLGSIGCATISPDKLGDLADELRAATNRGFNLNFFAHEAPVPNSAKNEQVRQRVAGLYDEAALGEPPASPGEPAFGTFDEARLAALLQIKPAVVSFHFGLPEAAMVAALKDIGCRILCSATNVAEARALETAGVDAVIAQGWEAGGHRGTFGMSFEDDGIGTMALVPQVFDAVRVPVIATGGIADGRGIAAAFCARRQRCADGNRFPVLSRDQRAGVLSRGPAQRRRSGHPLEPRGVRPPSPATQLAVPAWNTSPWPLGMATIMPEPRLTRSMVSSVAS